MSIVVLVLDVPDTISKAIVLTRGLSFFCRGSGA
jgi:hypothetical protein